MSGSARADSCVIAQPGATPVCVRDGAREWLAYCVLHAVQDEEESSTVTLDAAMALYDLHSFELLWEKALDTKVCRSRSPLQAICTAHVRLCVLHDGEHCDGVQKSSHAELR